MNSTQNQASMPLSLLFLRSIVAGMGIVLVGGFILVISMVLLGMKYFTDLRTCDAHPKGDIYLEISKEIKIEHLEIDCGIIKAKAANKLYGFDSTNGKLQFTVHY